MKKKINIVQALAVLTIGASSAVSCSLQSIGEHMATRPVVYHNWENGYIYGPDKDNRGPVVSGKGIDYFFGDTQFAYANYLQMGNGRYEFNGNLENVKRTKKVNKDLKVWRNDSAAQQILLFKKDGSENIQNIKISVESDDDSIEAKALFVNPTQSKNIIKNDWTLPLNQNYYSFDEVGRTSLDEMKFDIQPIVIQVKTKEDSTVGNHSLSVNISFTNDGVENKIDITKKVIVDAKSIDRSNDEINSFSSNGMSYPGGSGEIALRVLDGVIKTKKFVIKKDINKLTDEDIKSIILSKNESMPLTLKVDRTELIENNKVLRAVVEAPLYKVSHEQNRVDENSMYVYFSNNSFATSEQKIVFDNLDNSAFMRASVKSYNYDFLNDVSLRLPSFLSDDTSLTLDDKIGREFTDIHNGVNANQGYIETLNSMVTLVATNNNENLTVESFKDELSGNKIDDVKLFKDKNVSWESDFELFDRYIEWSYKQGMTKFYLPNSLRDGGKTTFYYRPKNKLNGEDVLVGTSPRNTFVDGKGNAVNDYEKALDQFVGPTYMKEMSIHIDEMRKSNDAFKNSRFYYSFDETSREINAMSIATYDKYLLKDENGKNNIGVHAYLGYQWVTSNGLDGNSFYEDTKRYDDITFGFYKYLAPAMRKGKVNEIKKLIELRKEKGLDTYLYSTNFDYPGGYLGSNPGDLMWDVYASYMVGSNGFGRYRWEGFTNDVTEEGVIRNLKNEASDEYVIYPGDQHDMFESLRYINSEVAVHDVWKLMTLQKDDEISNDQVDEILSSLTATRDEFANTKYQWNLNEYDNLTKNDFSIFNRKYTCINDQIEAIKSYVSLY